MPVDRHIFGCDVLLGQCVVALAESSTFCRSLAPGV